MKSEAKYWVKEKDRGRNGDDELRVVRLVERIGAPKTPREWKRAIVLTRDAMVPAKKVRASPDLLQMTKQRRQGEQNGKDFAMRAGCQTRQRRKGSKEQVVQGVTNKGDCHTSAVCVGDRVAKPLKITLARILNFGGKTYG